MSESTTDYSKFKKHESNRDIDSGNYKKIKNSILYKNLLHLRPILINKNWEVIDGQHRLQAAKELGVPIFYEMNNEAADEDIIVMNDNQKRWVLEDYLNYYCSKNYPHYLNLSKYMEEKNVSLGQAVSLFYGAHVDTRMQFRTGKFMMPENLDQANEALTKIKIIAELLKIRVAGRPDFLHSKGFIRCLLRFLSDERVDFMLLIKKLELNIGWIHRCSTTGEYKKMFTEIYNYKNREPLE